MKIKNLLILAIVFAFITLGTSCSSPTPSDTVKSYYEAMKAGDFEKACKYTDIADQSDVESFAAALREFGYELVSYEIISEKVAEDGQSATVNSKSLQKTVFNEEPMEDLHEFNLTKEDGKWLIKSE